MTTAKTKTTPPARPALSRLWSLLIRPRQTLGEITAEEKTNWLLPLAVLSATSAVAVLANGLIRRQIALAGEIALPPDFQWYTPEQQAQYMQAAQSVNGPVFLFVLPLLAALLKLWLGWLVVGGLLHLGLTLMGGRGSGGQALNLAAWAGLPFGLRDLLRAAAVLGSRSLIDAPGLSGFVPAGEGFGPGFLVAFLGMTDVFLIWHMLLLFLGALAYTGLGGGRVAGAAALSRLLPMALFALALAGLAQLGSLTFIRPFF
jgi:hypothetical protein